MGYFPTLTFTKEAPFSLKDLKVKITTVKGGKYTLAEPGWVPVPGDVKKW
jgi:branched-chain amino acid transport system substrate-binding protein